MNRVGFYILALVALYGWLGERDIEHEPYEIHYRAHQDWGYENHSQYLPFEDYDGEVPELEMTMPIEDFSTLNTTQL